jgi:hypothetical protein
MSMLERFPEDGAEPGPEPAETGGIVMLKLDAELNEAVEDVSEGWVNENEKFEFPFPFALALLEAKEPKLGRLHPCTNPAPSCDLCCCCRCCIEGGSLAPGTTPIP